MLPLAHGLPKITNSESTPTLDETPKSSRRPETRLELFVNKGCDSRREWATLVRPPPNGIAIDGWGKLLTYGVGSDVLRTGCGA